jgi:hypothetical protein
MLSLIQRLRRSSASPGAGLRRSLEREFSYRGTATLEIRQIEIADDTVEIGVYARPLFPGDRTIGYRSRETAFAEQIFGDSVRILRTAWREASQAARVNLTVWVKPMVAPQSDLIVLSTRTVRQHAPFLLAAERTAGLAPVEVLRRLPTRSRIDRGGKLREEGGLE